MWVSSLEGTPRHVFRGWAIWIGWAGQEELYVLEGKPDLVAALWRVRLDGARRTGPIARLRMRYGYQSHLPQQRFDVHPDGRRLVVEAHELFEADIGMIEGIRWRLPPSA